MNNSIKKQSLTTARVLLDFFGFPNDSHNLVIYTTKLNRKSNSITFSNGTEYDGKIFIGFISEVEYGLVSNHYSFDTFVDIPKFEKTLCIGKISKHKDNYYIKFDSIFEGEKIVNGVKMTEDGFNQYVQDFIIKSKFNSNAIRNSFDISQPSSFNGIKSKDPIEIKKKVDDIAYSNLTETMNKIKKLIIEDYGGTIDEGSNAWTINLDCTITKINSNKVQITPLLFKQYWLAVKFLSTEENLKLVKDFYRYLVAFTINKN